MKKIKVLLIEDNRLLREGTTSLLNAQRDIVAISSNGNMAAADKAKDMAPDVVLLDLGLKTKSALKVLAAIKKSHPRAEVVVMDLIPSHAEVAEFVEVGVSGYVPKNATLDDFLHTIRSVVKGVKILPPTMTDSLFSRIVDGAIQAGSVDSVIASVKLIKREQEVLNLLAEGKTIIETSRLLKLEYFTVKSHIRNILDKLALHTRLELLAFARGHATAPKVLLRKPKSRA
jgi:DNA-binding NarL/FixJ family response regulator